MERIEAAGRRLVEATSRRAFRLEGAQLGDDLFDAWWQTDLPGGLALMESMRRRGYTTVRIHVPFGPFMDNQNTANTASVAALGEFLDGCATRDMRVIVCGLNLYHPSLRPAWLDALTEAQRWTSFAVFWTAVAAECADKPACVCYDVINEPLVPNGVASSWYAGALLGFDFAANLCLDRGARTQTEVVTQFLTQQRNAIRAQDSLTPISWGLIGFPGFIPGSSDPFMGDTNLALIDWIMPHFYPPHGGIGGTLATVDGYAARAVKPLVVEESGNFGGAHTEEVYDFYDKLGERGYGWLGSLNVGGVSWLDAASPLQVAAQERALRRIGRVRQRRLNSVRARGGRLCTR